MPLSARGMWSRLRWPSVAIESAPAPVRKAWAEYEKAADKADAARAEKHEAERASAQAIRDDAVAALEATGRGKPVPPSCVEDRKQLAAIAARAFDAHASLAVRAEGSLLSAVRANTSAWLEDLAPQLDTAIDQTDKVLAASDESLSMVYGLVSVFRWLENGQERELRDAPVDASSHDSRDAIRDARSTLATVTPLSIRQAKQARAEKIKALKAEQARSVGGVVVRT